MSKANERKTFEINAEDDFEKMKKVFEEIDEILLPIVKEAEEWDPKKTDTTNLGLNLKKRMEKVNSLIPFNVTVNDSLDKYIRMDIYELLVNTVDSYIDKLSDIAEINISERKDDIFSNFQTRMNVFFQNLKEDSLDIVEESEKLKKDVFKNWLYSISKLKLLSKTNKDSYSNLELKIRNSIRDNFIKSEAKDILKEVKIMKKETKGKQIHKIIEDNLLPVLNDSVEMFKKILDKIETLKREIYNQTNEVLNENKKCDIIFEPFIKLIDLFQNIQKDFTTTFGELSKTKLNNINMKAQNISSYIKKSRMIISKNDKIASNNNAAFQKYNEMENIVDNLRLNAKESTIALNNVSKTGELSLVIEKTSKLFVTNINFVENFINWWGKNEFNTINHTIDNLSEMLPLKG